MNKNVISEINQMKFMFGYKPGKVISEQNIPMEEDFSEMEDVMVDDFDFGPEVAPAPTRERERTREKEREEEKTIRPSRPSRNPDELPGYNPHPQGSDEDEIEYELEIDNIPTMERPMRRRHRDLPSMERPMRRRHRDEDENIYEIEIDGDIEELFKK